VLLGPLERLEDRKAEAARGIEEARLTRRSMSSTQGATAASSNDQVASVGSTYP
jgi:hypothetical protein